MTTARLLERLDQAILDVIDNPEKTQQTTAIGTYSDKRSKRVRLRKKSTSPVCSVFKKSINEAEVIENFDLTYYRVSGT
jgi:hypothetical protein